jgi:CheY-like chemotaxis protein
LETALGDNDVPYNITVIMQGDKLMPHLQQAEELPHVIILDFNLPVKHGRELLMEIKQDERFSSIPVIVLTTSSAREDIDYSYRMGAKKFITKPTSLHGFTELVNTICDHASWKERDMR